MSIFARHNSILRLSSFCVLVMLAACGGKDGPGTETTGDTDATSSGTTVTGTGTTMPGTDTTTTGAGTTTQDTGTTTQDTDVVTGSGGENPCVASCASEEECTVDEDASTGVGGDSCDDNSHCVVRMDCACILSFCELDCDPADPATCEEGKTCDAGTGLCV
ncbi:MAG TPA: hypothetical protein VGB85_25305 [Nannocystis sp.]|jgi:hypothetical protein